MKKIIVMLMVSVLSLLVFGCTASQTTSPDGVDLPQPAGSDSALAGQGYAAGTYDHTYQLYNNFRPDGSMVSYLVENGNWVYLGDLRLGSRVHQSNLDLEVIGVSTDPQYPGAAIRLSTECREYSINFDNLGQYTITPDGHNPDIFSVPLSRPQPIRQIAGTDDAITIHSTSSSVAWFTLHCDNELIANCDYAAQQTCISDSSCYWDQQSGTCTDLRQQCIDPDNGQDLTIQSHTFGFRRVAANERDARIRTGGQDFCISTERVREHYCDSTFYIEATDLSCPTGKICQDGVCLAPQCLFSSTCNLNTGANLLVSEGLALYNIPGFVPELRVDIDPDGQGAAFEICGLQDSFLQGQVLPANGCQEFALRLCEFRRVGEDNVQLASISGESALLIVG